jgi:signal peptidase I
MNASFTQRHPYFKDVAGLLIFFVCVAVGTIFINLYVFRTFSVLGPSMETTMYTGDRLIVNRIPSTIAQLQNKQYVPERGQVIVFKNPNYVPSGQDEFIVKRVIAFPGEKVVVKDGKITVFNVAVPQGFNPDDKNNGEPGSPTSGNVETTVPDNELFVAGDHRQGEFSFDSRSGLGTIPYVDIIGPVSLRIWPVDKIRTF